MKKSFLQVENSNKSNVDVMCIDITVAKLERFLVSFHESGYLKGVFDKICML